MEVLPGKEEKLMEHAPLRQRGKDRGISYADRTVSQPTYRERIKRLIPWMLASVAIISLGTWLLYRLFPVCYTSSTLFLVDVPSVEEDRDALPDLPPQAVTQLVYLSRSTAMLDHLIDRFPLMRRVGGDPADVRQRESYYPVLLDHITSRQLEAGSVELEVRDVDRELAMNMANEMFAFLVGMMEDRVHAALQRDMGIYEQMIDTMGRSANQQATALLASAREIDGMMRDRRTTRQEMDPLLDARNQLSAIATELSLSHRELSRLKERYAFALTLQKKDPAPTLRCINRAVMDVNTMPWLAVIGTALVWSGIAVLFFLLLPLLWHLHGAEFLRYLRDLDRGILPR